MTSDRIKYTISTSFIVYTILSLVILATIGMSVFQSQFIYPRFLKQLIDNTENEAIRTGNHLKRIVLEHFSDEQIKISDKTKVSLEIIVTDYDLWKIKIFSNLGEILYSTSDGDIGIFNKKSYFHDIVAKGNTYTKVVAKDGISLEGQKITSDVVETYVPILHQNEFVGAFELYYNITARKKAMDELISRFNNLLYILTLIIIVIVVLVMLGFRKSMQDRKRFEIALFEMANTDKLTGIYNRRRFLELLEIEIDKFNRYKSNPCIMLFDIDHFKNVNDTYGHQVGDEVLVGLAGICKKVLRKTDIFSRYGGEEFILFLPEIDEENALNVAEKLRNTIASTPIPSSEGEISITISIGFTLFKTVDALSMDSLIKQADDALYKAKNRGRNQVVCAK